MAWRDLSFRELHGILMTFGEFAETCGELAHGNCELRWLLRLRKTSTILNSVLPAAGKMDER